MFKLVRILSIFIVLILVVFRDIEISKCCSNENQLLIIVKLSFQLIAVFMFFAVAAAAPKPQFYSSVYPSVYSGVYSGLPVVRSVSPYVASPYVASSVYSYPSVYRSYGGLGYSAYV